jgi:hypothetical protein
MSDPLTDLITDIQHNGVRWVTVITVYAMFRKERRNHLLNKRDTANFENQYEIMKAMGVGDKWKNGPKFGLKTTDLPNLRRFFLLSHKEIIQNPRREKTMIQFLKSNISKKLLALIIGVAVTALNSKFNLQLSENDIYILFAGVIAYVLGQSHVDAKKIIANSVIAVSDVVQASTGVTADTTYKDLYPTIKSVHEGINSLLSDVQKNDGSQAFKDAASTYMSIMDIIKSIQHPDPLPKIPVQQESA